MSAKFDQAMEDVYVSIQNDNENIDACIDALKSAMKEEGVKEAVFKPERLAQSNREGRQFMKSYFKKRGVAVAFDKSGS